MPNLTEEQIEAAAKAAYGASRRSSFQDESRFPLQVYWNALSVPAQQDYRAGVCAAAPLLQMPWEPATMDELKSSCQAFTMDGLRTHTCHGVPLAAMEYAIREFVSRRNFALIPKPVDPRREKIERVLRDPSSASVHVSNEGLATRILAALDAKE